MILGIDTATSTASAALVENGRLLGEQIHAEQPFTPNSRVSTPKGNHAEVILPLIQSLLSQTGTSIDALSGVAVSIGPGSFTGLRIGLATAKGIAYERSLPIVGVSTLHANAASVGGDKGLICSLLDARKKEVYTALFHHDEHQVVRLTEDVLTSIEGTLHLIRKQNGAAGSALRFVGDGVKAYERIIARELGVAAPIRSEGDGSVAAQVAQLAEARFRAQQGDDIGSLKPVYLRSSEAEEKFRKTHLTY